MRRQVTVGGLVALALLSGSVVAFAAPAVGCAPAAAGESAAGPGLVPSAAGPDDPDGSGDDDPPDDPGGDAGSGDDRDDDSAADDPVADDDSAAGDSTGDSAGADPVPSGAPSADGPAGDTCAAPTAAEAFGWGEPAAVDEFDGPLGGDWRIYSGTGFDGQGTRTADALTVDDGILTITGDADGATGGMAWATGQEYGRWEARVRTPASDPSYNALLLLWPEDPSTAGGEIDFMEMLDPARQTASAFVHPGAEAAPAMGEVAVDGTAWHTWAVEWTPTAVTTYLDGVPWWTVDDPALLPSGPMHLCVQLDWFPTGAEEVRESSMQVDWVRQYPLDAPADDPAPGPAAPTDGGDRAPEPSAPVGTDPATSDPATSDPAPAADGSPRTERLSEGAPDAPARPGLVPRAVRGT